MKNILLLLLLLSPELALAKVNPTDYSLSVHVQSSRLVTNCHTVAEHAFCANRQSLSVVIGGKKYELLGHDDADAALRTGDYKARMLAGDASADAAQVPAYEINDKNTYEFLFPDGKKLKYSVIGESE